MRKSRKAIGWWGTVLETERSYNSSVQQYSAGTHVAALLCTRQARHGRGNAGRHNSRNEWPNRTFFRCFPESDCRFCYDTTVIFFRLWFVYSYCFLVSWCVVCNKVSHVREHRALIRTRGFSMSVCAIRLLSEPSGSLCRYISTGNDKTTVHHFAFSDDHFVKVMTSSTLAHQHEATCKHHSERWKSSSRLWLFSHDLLPSIKFCEMPTKGHSQT